MSVRTSFDPLAVAKILKKIPMFGTLSDEEFSSLLGRTNAYSFRQGETIFLEDDTSPLMYIILKGRVKVVEITPDGQERLMAYRHKGDYFGDMSLLDGKSDFATVIATDQCKMLLITKDLFDEFLMGDIKALRRIIAVLCGRLRESWLFHKIIGTNDAESKIRVTLARYGKTLGIQDSSGVIINSALSHQGIGDRLQITRETATRVLLRMREQNEIEITTGRRIKLLPAFYEKTAQCALYEALSGIHNNH